MNLRLQSRRDDASFRANTSDRSVSETESGIWPFGELIQYCCAVAVSDELHFTRAAHRLHMDQSAVSRHVQRLEATLGVKLFNRGTRGVELTDAGVAFASRARKALRTAREAATTARSIGNGEPQHLDIVYSSLVDVHAVAEIKRIVEKDVTAAVRFRSVPPDELTERLWDGTAHAGLGLLPVGADLSHQKLFREELLIAAPETLRFGTDRKISIGRLNDLPMIWPFGAESLVSRQILGMLRDLGCTPVIALQAHSASEALASVREGFGITLAKASDLQLRPRGVTFRRVAGRPIQVETGLIYVPDLKWNNLNRVVALITDQFRSMPSGTRALSRTRIETVRKKLNAAYSRDLAESIRVR